MSSSGRRPVRCFQKATKRRISSSLSLVAAAARPLGPLGASHAQERGGGSHRRSGTTRLQRYPCLRRLEPLSPADPGAPYALQRAPGSAGSAAGVSGVGRDRSPDSPSGGHWGATLAIGATVTATSLSFGRRPGSFRCMKPQWIFAIGLAATSPAFGDGEAIQSRQADAKASITSSRPAEERRGHRYLLRDRN